MGVFDFKEFVFRSNKVLPTEYDDALSYYEVLGKVAARLNDVTNFTNALANSLVAPYDSEVQYEPGDYVWYNNALYKCTTANYGSFNLSDWGGEPIVFTTSVGDDIISLTTYVKTAIENQQSLIERTIAGIATPYDEAHNYEPGDYVSFITPAGAVIYKCIENTTGTFDSNKWVSVVAINELFNYVNELWSAFFENYTRTWGIVNLMGDSEADAMSQKGVTDLVYNLIEHGSYNAAKRYTDVTSFGVTYTSTRDGYHCEGEATNLSSYALISPNYPTMLFRKNVTYKVKYKGTNNLNLVVHYGNEGESVFANTALSTFDDGIYYVRIPNTAVTYGAYVSVASGLSVNGDFNVEITEYASNKELEEQFNAEMKREYGGEKYSGNLVESLFINNTSIVPTTGNLANTKGVFITQWIDIGDATTLYTNCAARYAFYDEEKAFMSSQTLGNLGGEKEISVPAGAKYIVLSGTYTSRINPGNIYLYSVSPENREKTYYLPYDSLTTDKTNKTIYGNKSNNANLIDLFDIAYGYAIQAPNGRLVSNASAYVTGYINVIPGETLYTNARARYSFYDSSLAQIFTATFGGASGEKSFVVPTNASFLKLSNTFNYFPPYELTLYRVSSEMRDTGIEAEGILRTVAQMSKNKNDNSFFNGKKCAWIGDSISYGSNLANVMSAYPYLTANKLGMNISNHSIGGSSLAKQEGSYAECFTSFSEWEEAIANNTLDTTKKYLVKDNNSTVRPYGMYQYSGGSWSSLGNTAAICGYYPIVDRIKEVEADSDVIVVAAGTNDFYWGTWTEDDVEKKGGLTPIGSMSDRNKTTLYGALHTICTYLTTNFHDKQFVFVTPIQRYQNNHWNCTTPYAENGRGESLKGYSDIIKEVCEYYSIPVVDMFSISGLVPSLEHSLFVTQSYGYVHPNEAGHKRMASVATSAIAGTRTLI